MNFIARQEISVGNADTGSAFDMTAIFPGSTSIEKIVEWSVSRYKSAAYGRLIITVAETPTSESLESPATDSQQINDKIALKLEYILVRLQHNTGTEWKYECVQAANECLELLHH